MRNKTKWEARPSMRASRLSYFLFLGAATLLRSVTVVAGLRLA